MNATIVVAIIGILGTLAGGLSGHYLQARLKERGDRAAKLNEARIALYLEAVNYVVRKEAWLAWLQEDPDRSGPNLPDGGRVELISGKMALFASSNVMNAWRHMLKVSDDLTWYLENEFPGAYERAVPDIPPLLAVRDAIVMLRNTMRRALGTPDD